MQKEKIEWNTFLSFGENKNDCMSLFSKYLQTDEGIDLVDGLMVTVCGRRTIWFSRKGSERYVLEKAGTKIPYFASCQL